MDINGLKGIIAKIAEPSKAVISLYERSTQNDVCVDVYSDYQGAQKLEFRDYGREGMTYERVLDCIREHARSAKVSIALHPGNTIVYRRSGRANVKGLAALRARDQQRAARKEFYKTYEKSKGLEKEIVELEALDKLLPEDALRRDTVTVVSCKWCQEEEISIPVPDARKYIVPGRSRMRVSIDGIYLSVPHPDNDEEDNGDAWREIRGFVSYADAYRSLKGLKGVDISVGRYLDLPFCPPPEKLAELVKLRISEKQAHWAGLKARLEYLRELEIELRKFACSFWMKDLRNMSKM